MQTSRVQLALNVTDIDAATRFYSDLFGVEPAKQRPGYANFVVADPPLKLVLFEHPSCGVAAQPSRRRGPDVGRRGRRGESLSCRRPGPQHDRIGSLLPRRPGQGVGRRS